MKVSKKRQPLGQRLIRGMEDGLAAFQNDQPLPLIEIPRPPDPAPFNQDQMVSLRRRLRWSQAAMAAWLNVSCKTVQSWEQGSRKPSGSALRLLQILELPLILQRFLPGTPMIQATKATARAQSKKVRGNKQSA